MTLATFLPVVGGFKADAIGVGEVGYPIVRSVYGIEFCIGCRYASPAKLSCYGCHVYRCIDTKAEVVQGASTYDRLAVGVLDLARLGLS